MVSIEEMLPNFLARKDIFYAKVTINNKYGNVSDRQNENMVKSN